MGTLKHPLVEDRVILGEGTAKEQWLKAFKEQPLAALDLELFRSKRVVIVAPHPDDEVLGCGGLMQQLIALNCKILVLAVSNGTQKSSLTLQNILQISLIFFARKKAWQP